MEDQTEQDSSFLSDIGGIFSKQFDSFLGVLIENEKEPVPVATVPTNSPSEVQTTAPAISSTGEPINYQMPFYQKPNFILWVVLGVLVVLLILLMTGVI